MYAYPQHRPHFYENQRRWEEFHQPLSPNPYEMYSDNEYYYPDPSINSKRHAQYDGPLEEYSAQHPLAPNRYADAYYPDPDYYYYYEPAAEDEANDLYYYHPHQNPHHRHGARSASPSKRKDRKRQHSRLRHKSSFKKKEAWIQPTPFVNPQPMIMDPMMSLQHQQILGTCTTDAMMPVIPNNFGLMPQAPMINPTQPYFMPLPPTSANYPSSFAFHHQQQQQQQQVMLPFVQPMPHPPLLSDLFNTLSIQDNSNNKPANEADQTETTAAKQEPSPAVQQKQQPKTAPSTPMTRPAQRPLQRRRSMMETVLSSFSLLGDNQSSTNLAHKSWDPSTYVSLNEALKVGATSNATDMDAKNESAISSSLSPRSVGSAPSAATASATKHEESGSATLSRRDSLKLSQKMNALQSRHYIWCYKPQNEEAALWAAFDVKNQRKLDHHYAKLASKKQQIIQQQQQQENDKAPATAADAAAATTSFLPDDVITLSKQSQLHGPVIVSLNKATAWCFDNDSSFSFGSSGQKHVVLDIACLPSQQNRFVVSNQLVSKDPVVRRSKSVDGGLATKFINSVLKW
ncbi:hypothetical protein V8B55DRAFT_1513144 [Mucor lusitanicus]|uniref:Uncharacterized protein n=2 Tax=Mucor circinelloides f. lusitanicus TaxID=29924 RepID=A0A168GMM3_MUCCL|nr:hypothetical protein FB192DRAFT_1372272 [Mucor lusitanicus]OAC97844.1 hypothetical protein MUCCIDRAFT_93546 [Mucor lusitanicus CBS 277.49]